MTAGASARTVTAVCIARDVLFCEPIRVADSRFAGDIAFDTDGNSGSVLLAEVDGGDTSTGTGTGTGTGIGIGIGTRHGSFDAAPALPSLAAGQYRVTLAALPNLGVGPSLAAGFAFDGSAPIAIAAWTQSGSDPSGHDHKGSIRRADSSGARVQRRGMSPSIRSDRPTGEPHDPPD